MRATAVLLLLLFPPLTPALAAVPGADDPARLAYILQEAVDAPDSAAALRHLDLESLVAAAIDEELPRINERVKRGELILSPPLALALAGLNEGSPAMRGMISGFLAAELGKFIAYGIDGGFFAGRPRPDDELALLDGGVFSLLGRISGSRKELSGAETLILEGDSALIRLELSDAATGGRYPLELRLRRADGLWKIIRIENTAALFPPARP
ncbi:MAG: hypothetical protein LBQ63_03970 [Deltaproteobacteria bacterium]|jgi:hypothetical protein|nr:hypothetical protein [Deltaproteobacteria bacterium]